jgi:hypothetical protein
VMGATLTASGSAGMGLLDPMKFVTVVPSTQILELTLAEPIAEHPAAVTTLLIAVNSVTTVC